jgi:hypothetical protein
LRCEEHELEQIFDVAQTIFDSDSGHVYDFATLENGDLERAMASIARRRSVSISESCRGRLAGVLDRGSSSPERLGRKPA